MPPKSILILGGTTEARVLAERLTAHTGYRVITSLAGRLAPTHDLPGEVRIGGFGGWGGLRAYLRDQRIDALADLTHPFAAQISAHARLACDAEGIPRLQFCRPTWTPPQGLDWQRFDTLDDLATALDGSTGTALISIGVQGLSAFRNLTGPKLIVRLVMAPDGPLALKAPHTIVTGRPPFTLANERALFQTHGINILVTKESGGTAMEAKIVAAEEAGARVLALSRPAPEPGPSAASVDQVLDWLAGF